jgi:hypothetical protein
MRPCSLHLTCECSHHLRPWAPHTGRALPPTTAPCAGSTSSLAPDVVPAWHAPPSAAGACATYGNKQRAQGKLRLQLRAPRASSTSSLALDAVPAWHASPSLAGARAASGRGGELCLQPRAPRVGSAKLFGAECRVGLASSFLGGRGRPLYTADYWRPARLLSVAAVGCCTVAGHGCSEEEAGRRTTEWSSG